MKKVSLVIVCGDSDVESIAKQMEKSSISQQGYHVLHCGGVEELSKDDIEELVSCTDIKEVGYLNEAELSKVEVGAVSKEEKVFVNGFHSWRDTNYEVVGFITSVMHKEDHDYKAVAQAQESGGRCEVWELSALLVDAFEKTYQNYNWDDGDYYDKIDEFCEKHLIMGYSDLQKLLINTLKK